MVRERHWIAGGWVRIEAVKRALGMRRTVQRVRPMTSARAFSPVNSSISPITSPGLDQSGPLALPGVVDVGRLGLALQEDSQEGNFLAEFEDRFIDLEGRHPGAGQKPLEALLGELLEQFDLRPEEIGNCGEVHETALSKVAAVSDCPKITCGK